MFVGGFFRSVLDFVFWDNLGYVCFKRFVDLLLIIRERFFEVI